MRLVFRGCQVGLSLVGKNIVDALVDRIECLAGLQGYMDCLDVFGIADTSDIYPVGIWLASNVFYFNDLHIDPLSDPFL